RASAVDRPSALYPLSLHDALPILLEFGPDDAPEFMAARAALRDNDIDHQLFDAATASARFGFVMPTHWSACLAPDSGYLRVQARSEEHTSELQSRENLVCRLLLEK